MCQEGNDMRRASPTYIRIFLAAGLGAWAVPAMAGAKATFLGDGTYATAEGCAKLKALAAGTPRNLNTVPETLTASGYQGWEHSCSFTSIKPIRKDKTWRVGTQCMEGPQRWQAVEAFERQADGSIKITSEKTTTTFVRCQTGAKTGKGK